MFTKLSKLPQILDVFIVTFVPVRLVTLNRFDFTNAYALES